jgi:peptide deformylase
MNLHIPKQEQLKSYTIGQDLFPILTYPHPILKQVAPEIKEEDFDTLMPTIEKMLHTMYWAPGIGLAAPQVGLSLKFFVMDIDYQASLASEAPPIETLHHPQKAKHPYTQEEWIFWNLNPQFFLNPVILKKERETSMQEGCLSVPGIFENVIRAETITILHQSLTNEKREMTLSQLASVCFQHELDHCFGKVFLERLTPLKRELATKKYLKIKNK